MADEPEKHDGDAEGDPLAVEPPNEAENERPTVSPPFDPIAFARDVLRPSPAKGIGAIVLAAVARSTPPDAHTHATPPQGTEQQAAAAEASRPSLRPEAESAPDSLAQIARARLPANEPPKIALVPERHDSLSDFNAVDSEWGDMELATRPPPADGPGEDPVIEVASDRGVHLDLDEVDLVEHTAQTAPTVRKQVPFADPPTDLELAAPPPPPPPVLGEREMNDRVSLGDYSGALEIAEKILVEKPGNLSAKACAESCRSVLRKMYAARIGPLDRVPMVMVPRDQLRWLSIDHKAGFVLSLVDGVSSLEMIIDVSGMPELDTLRILSELAQQRIISMR